MKKLNQSYKRRDFLLAPFFTDKEYSGGIRSFAWLNSWVATLLLKEGFADPKDRQNDAPSFEEFVVFMIDNPDYMAHGYAVHQNRGDYRITIEGLEAKNPTKKEIKVFRKFNKNADELTDTRSWYD